MKKVFTLLVVGAAIAWGQQSVPDIPFESVPDFLKLPEGMNFGEVPGVAVNSQGHVFVFTRSNSAQGPAYAPAAAQLLEFPFQRLDLAFGVSELGGRHAHRGAPVSGRNRPDRSHR
mgnify:CR=1 FL=1